MWVTSLCLLGLEPVAMVVHCGAFTSQRHGLLCRQHVE